MKIIILTDVYLPYVGGGQVFLSNVVSRLCQKKDMEIEILTRRLIVDAKAVVQNEILENGRLKITRLGIPAKWNNIFSRLAYIFLASAYLMNKKFDLIDAQAFIGGVPGKIISILKRKPVILTVHGTSLEIGRAGILEKLILTKIKYNVEISAAANFLKIKNINKNIKVVNPGVDSDFYKPDFSKKEKNRILFVGRLQKVKGTETLYQCINLSAKNRSASHVSVAQKGERKDLADTFIPSNCKWVIVGDGEEMDTVMSKVKKENIKNVEFKGSLSHKKTLEEYQKASLFVLPSESEGFPLTLLEALSCGLPCVASNVGDIAVLIKDNVNGYTVKQGNSNDFAKNIKNILKDDKLREQMAVNNREKAKNYSWDETSDKIYKIYKQYD